MRYIAMGILLTLGATASAQSPPPPVPPPPPPAQVNPPRSIGSTGSLSSTRSEVHATERAVPPRTRVSPRHGTWSDDSTGANTMVPDAEDRYPQ